MQAHELAALDAIAAVYAEPVTYTGAGLVAAPVPAVRSDSAADSFQGPGATLREVSYEIQRSELPQEPRKGNIIEDATGRWSVDNIVRRDDIAAWVLIVIDEADA